MTNPPWRFRVGDHVWVRGHHPDERFEILGGELWRTFPHYLVRDLTTGEEWLMPQLQLSRKPLTR